MPTVPEPRPTETPLPQSPPGDFMTPDQWEVFYALLDGALPAITSKSKAAGDGLQIALPDDEFKALLKQAAKGLPDGQSTKDLADFFACRLSTEPALRDDCLRMLAVSPAKAKLASVMGMMNTRVGSLLFTGYWQPITMQPTPVREAILKSWDKSRFATLKNLAKVITGLAMKGAVVTNEPFHRLSGYTNIPKNWTRVEGYPFDFIQPGAGNEPYVIETDVVVVGSGPGGGVSAKNLSEAGHRVLVVDKGYYFPPSQLPMPLDAGAHHLLDNSGAIFSEDGGVNILAGSNWGGGGTVNWSVCLRTQDYVRKEWVDAGLPMFGTKRYDQCLDRVWDFVGAGMDAIRHNHRNNAVLEGSRKLGWKAYPVAQNTANKEHYCGRCYMGCGSGEKRGPAVAWLPAAAEAGAQFMEGFQAEKIVFDKDGKTATGVEGQWLSRGPRGSVSAPQSERTKRRVQIKAKRVIVSGGSLRSPLLLEASGIENPQVGKNLYIHPANIISTTFDEQTDGWEGGIITACNSEFENLDGKGHGVKIETACMMPTTSLAGHPWSSGINSKLLMAKYSRLGTFITITRERDTGSVFRDPKTGNPRIVYEISDFDREHAIEGLAAISKICYVSGATEIQPYLPDIKPLIVDQKAAASFLARSARGEVKDPEFTDPALAAWLQHLRTTAASASFRPIASAHQMGTCRMSATADTGVVDEMGKVWGREGLYVADGSVLPSASGVNPMITIMAISDWISRGVSQGL